MGPSVPGATVPEPGSPLPAFVTSQPFAHAQVWQGRLMLAEPAGSGQPTYPATADVSLVPRADGGAWLIWNTGEYQDATISPPPRWGGHVQRLDADLKAIGPAVDVTPDMTLQTGCALPDGGFAAIGCKRKYTAKRWWWPHEAWYLRFDATGHEVARTLITGAGDVNAGETFYPDFDAAIASNGDRVACYIGVRHNFDKPGGPVTPDFGDTHQLDMFRVFGPDDQPLASYNNYWQASHSSLLQVCAGREQGQFFQATVTDGTPPAVLFANASTKQTVAIWKPPGTEVAHTASAGLLYGLNEVGSHVYASFGGADVLNPPMKGYFDEERAPMLLGMDAAGQVKRKHVLDEARFGANYFPSKAFGDGRLLIGWGSGGWEAADTVPGTPKPARFAIYDAASDKVLEGPVDLKVPLDYNVRWTRLVDGSVAWAVCREPDLRVVQLVRISPK